MLAAYCVHNFTGYSSNLCQQQFRGFAGNIFFSVLGLSNPIASLAVLPAGPLHSVIPQGGSGGVSVGLHRVLFLRKSSIIFSICRLGLTSLLGSRYGRSLLAALLHILSFRSGLPCGYTAFDMPACCSASPRVVNLRDAGNVPSIFFSITNGFLRKFFFLHFTRLASLPYAGYLANYLAGQRLFVGGISLELFFFLGLRAEILESGAGVLAQVY
jgi:hypothetical protein